MYVMGLLMALFTTVWYVSDSEIIETAALVAGAHKTVSIPQIKYSFQYTS